MKRTIVGGFMLGMVIAAACVLMWLHSWWLPLAVFGVIGWVVAGTLLLVG